MAIPPASGSSPNTFQKFVQPGLAHVDIHQPMRELGLQTKLEQRAVLLVCLACSPGRELHASLLASTYSWICRKLFLARIMWPALIHRRRETACTDGTAADAQQLTI